MNPKMTATDASSFLGISLQAIHKQLRKKNLFFSKSQNRVYFGHETARIIFNLPPVKKVVAAQIVKGGTGKTSLILGLAVRASLYGVRVLCIDMDQQGNLSQAFSVDPEELPCMIDIINKNISIEDAVIEIQPGIHLLPSRIENAVLDNIIMLKGLPLDRVYRNHFDQLRKHYDLILVDCPPALGQSVAAVALAVDLIISPVTPEKFSLSGLKITSDELHNIEENYKCNIPIKIILNKFDNRTILSHEVLSSLVKHPIYGDLLFKSYIRASQEFPNSIAKNQTIFDTLKTTSTAKDDVDLLTQELIEIDNFKRAQTRTQT